MSNEDIDLVRFEMADIARIARMPCLAHCCGVAESPAHWRAVALEFSSCASGTAAGSMHAASAAARRLAAGDVGAAIELLAGAMGEPAGSWRGNVERHRARGGCAVAEPWKDDRPPAGGAEAALGRLTAAVAALDGGDRASLVRVTPDAMASVMAVRGWSRSPEAPDESGSPYDLFTREDPGTARPWTALVPRRRDLRWPEHEWPARVVDWARTVGAVHFTPAALVLAEALAASEAGVRGG